MGFLDNHCLSMENFYLPQDTGRQISQYLTDTKVEPVGEWRGPARVGGVRIGGFSFALIEFGIPMGLQVKIRSDHFLILSCLRGTAKLNVDGQRMTIGAGQGIIARPARYLRAECSKDCIRLPVRIDPHLVACDLYPDPEVFGIDDEAMRPWFEAVQMLLSSRALLAATAHDEVLEHSIEAMLFRLLQNSSLPVFHSRRSPAVSRDVRRAELFMRANITLDVSLGEIAAAVGANVRTLQSNFLRYRNISPMHYLKNLRLDWAHDLLVSGTGSVSDVALQSGFSHFGRFAADYRSRFGETPSTTLQQSSHPRDGRGRAPKSAIGHEMFDGDEIFS